MEMDWSKWKRLPEWKVFERRAQPTKSNIGRPELLTLTWKALSSCVRIYLVKGISKRTRTWVWIFSGTTTEMSAKRRNVQPAVLTWRYAYIHLSAHRSQNLHWKERSLDWNYWWLLYGSYVSSIPIQSLSNIVAEEERILYKSYHLAYLGFKAPYILRSIIQSHNTTSTILG